VLNEAVPVCPAPGLFLPMALTKAGQITADKLTIVKIIRRAELMLESSAWTPR